MRPRATGRTFVLAAAWLAVSAAGQVRAQDVAAWVQDAGHPDAFIRDAARRELLENVTVQDLPALGDAWRQAGRTPAAEGAVRAAFYHAHLREAAAESSGRAGVAGEFDPLGPGRAGGFIGLSAAPGRAATLRQVGLRMERVAAAPGAAGWAPIPGFAGATVLREGDVLHAVGGIRDDGTTAGLTAIEAFEDLALNIGGVSPGTTLRLVVQRGGRFMWVDVRLDRRPPGAMEDWPGDAGRSALRAAQEAWATHVVAD